MRVFYTHQRTQISCPYMYWTDRFLTRTCIFQRRTLDLSANQYYYYYSTNSLQTQTDTLYQLLLRIAVQIVYIPHHRCIAPANKTFDSRV